MINLRKKVKGNHIKKKKKKHEGKQQNIQLVRAESGEG